MDVKLHVDLETLQLILGPGQRSAVASLRFKRGDSAKLQVVFLENGITPTTIGDPDTLDIQFKGKNIAEILDMPVAEAVDFFANQPAIHRYMQTLMDVQTRMGEQSEKMTPDVWKQFMNMQLPMVQGMLGSNLDQSKNLLTQLQEQMQKQTEQVLSSFGLKR